MPRAIPLVLKIGLLAMVYIVAGRLALLLAIPPGYATAIFPSAGIALGSILLFRIEVDSYRFLQVMSNLLSNVVKYTPLGGSVEISVSIEFNCAKVSIKDHGPGIAEDFRERIFQKFAQADASDARMRGGTGLGLSIVKTIVEIMGGQVGYDTVQGEGTVFYFLLPLVYANAKDESDADVVGLANQ